MGSWVFEPQTGNVNWSAGMYAVLGIEPDVPASQSLFQSIVYPDDVDLLEQHTANLIKGVKGHEALFFRFIRQNDQAIRYAVSEYRYENDMIGKPLRVYGIVKDVTEQRLAEEEREKFIEEIVQRHKDLEQFTYIVSHNLRLPVANILGFADILQFEEISKEDKEDFIGLIITSVTKLDEVVKDLNQVLQIRRDIQENREWVILDELITSISDSIRQIILTEEVIIETEFFELSELFSVKSYLYSVFYNLISNSIKYRRKDIPPRIHIKSQLLAGEVNITYRDNGSGIDLKKHQHDVFGLYKRFHSQVEGKGMGLYMVKTQVESLGGRISLRSEPNKGVEFKLTFDVDKVLT